MKLRQNFAWLMAAVGGICLGAAAVGLSQPHAAAPAALAPAPIHSPSDLSLAFREVAKRALPAVVSITTETKAREIARGGRRGNGPQEGMSPDEEMLREFFGSNPQMEQFFRGMPQGQGPRQMPRQQGAGSGFIVDASGIILTNSHVVEGADKVTVKLQDGRELQAESWNFDPRTDVAIVRVKAEGSLPALALGDSSQMDIGDWVLALGNPFNVGTTVTAGIISATGRGPHINEREEYLQTDAAINPGNSGGPLVNLFGEVIGINTAISTRSGGYDGVGFAIPSKNVRWVADQLISHGSVNRSYLGVALQELSNDLRSQLHVPLGKGALISEVRPDTPAEKAKLQAGDIILDVAGRAIRDRDDLIDAVERAAPNKTYDLKILRDGHEMTVAVKLEPMPSDYTPALQRARAKDRPAEKAQEEHAEVAKLGVEVAALDNELTERMGLPKDSRGVVVKNVQGGGPAEEYGLQAGDVIQRVGASEVKNVEDFRAAINNADLSKGVMLYLKRGKDSAFIVVKEAK